MDGHRRKIILIGALCAGLLVSGTITFGAQQAQGRGRIVNRDGAPLRGFRVQFYYLNQDERSAPVFDVYTDEYGYFLLKNPRQENYRVRVSFATRSLYVKDKVWIDDKGSVHPMPFVVDW